MLYFKNMVLIVNGSKNKIKFFIINCKIIVLKNILNNYLIYIKFKNIYYHLYKINIFLLNKNEYPRIVSIKNQTNTEHSESQCN